MKGVWLVGLAALALSGCKSSSERLAEDDTYCRSIGAAPGTDGYTQCRLQLRGEKERREAQFRANPPFRSQTPIIAPGVAPQQQTTCTTEPYLGRLQTTCR